jgi:putative flippase GtrA
MKKKESRLLHISKKIFKNKTDDGIIQFFRYGFVSAAAVFVDFSCLIIFTEIFGFYHVVSGVIGYALGMIVNYLLSIFWVFDKNRFDNRIIEFIIFVSIGLIGMGINSLLLWLLPLFLYIHYTIARVISMIIGQFWKYFARKYILFSTAKKE